MKTVSLCVALVFAIALSFGSINRSASVSSLDSYYNDGVLKESIQVDDQGRKHGVCRWYFEDGSLKREEHLSHGVWSYAVEYWQNGRMKERMSVDWLSTKMEFWNEDGTSTR